jgi:hypothetical protein
MLETGRFATIKEIAKGEKIDSSYVSRVLRLTLLAPDIVEASLDGRTTGELSLAEAMGRFLSPGPSSSASFPSIRPGSARTETSSGIAHLSILAKTQVGSENPRAHLLVR